MLLLRMIWFNMEILSAALSLSLSYTQFTLLFSVSMFGASLTFVWSKILTMTELGLIIVHLQVKQSRFIAFSFTDEMFVSIALFFSIHLLNNVHMNIFTDSVHFRSRRNLSLVVVLCVSEPRCERNDRRKRPCSFCHEQFHANRFIKLGSKTNFKMRLRTISNIISTWEVT